MERQNVKYIKEKIIGIITFRIELDRKKKIGFFRVIWSCDTFFYSHLRYYGNAPIVQSNELKKIKVNKIKSKSKEKGIIRYKFTLYSKLENVFDTIKNKNTKSKRFRNFVPYWLKKKKNFVFGIKLHDTVFIIILILVYSRVDQRIRWFWIVG